MEIDVQDVQEDNRPLIKLEAIGCRDGDWVTPLTEDRAAVYDAMEKHAKETGHKGFWQYQLQRSELNFLGTSTFRRRPPQNQG